MEFLWIFIIILLLSALNTINQLRTEMTRTNSILEKIAKQIGVPDTTIANIDEELKDLIAKGKKIEAIKKYREFTGFGLKEAKDYIDSLDK